MKMRIMGIEEEFHFLECTSNLLLIKNTILFTSLIMYLEGLPTNIIESNEIIFEREDKIFNFKKDGVVVVDLFQPPIDSKKSMTKIIKYINELLNVEYEIKTEIEKNLCNIVSLVENILFDIDYDLEYSAELDVEYILKGLGIKVKIPDSRKLLDRLLWYVDYLSIFETNSYVIFINANIYLNKEELTKLSTYCLYRKISVLFLSNLGYNSDVFDNVFVIDEDYYTYKEGPSKL